MKKKVALAILCGITLLSVCGCGKEKKKEEFNLVGEYKQVDTDNYGWLTLYQNGTCDGKYWFKSYDNKYYSMELEKAYCSYDYTDKTLAISRSSSVSDLVQEIKCNIENNKLDCGKDGIFEKK